MQGGRRAGGGRGGGRRALPTPPLGHLTEAERSSTAFSKTLRYLSITVPFRGSAVPLQVGVMGPPQVLDAMERGGAPQAPVPVALAISGERQQHVSKFFQAFVPERRGWVTVTPLRPDPCPLFFKAPSDELLHALAQTLLQMLAVEGGKFHVLGTSNGGTSTMRFGCRWPELCHSLTVVTGTLTQADEGRIQRIAGIPVAIFAGDQDELGFYEAAIELFQILEMARHSPAPEITILPGAGHFTVGQFVDMAAFWARLERLRPQHQGEPGAAAPPAAAGGSAAAAPPAGAAPPAQAAPADGAAAAPLPMALDDGANWSSDDTDTDTDTDTDGDGDGDGMDCSDSDSDSSDPRPRSRSGGHSPAAVHPAAEAPAAGPPAPGPEEAAEGPAEGGAAPGGAAQAEEAAEGPAEGGAAPGGAAQAEGAADAVSAQ